MSPSHKSMSPASYAQRSLWAFALRYRTAHLNEMTIAWRARGPLRIDALESALGQVVARHPTLRSRLSYERGQLFQVEMPPEPVPLRVIDVDAASPEAGVEVAVEMFCEPRRQALDIIAGPTFLAHLYRVAADDHVLGIQVHHAMCDGWSMGIVVREWILLYRELLGGPPADLPQLTEQYAHIASWEQRALEAGELDHDIQYWRAELEDLPPPIALPAAGTRKGNRDWRARAVHTHQQAPFMQGLRDLAGRLRVSPFALQLAALAVLLRQRTGREDMLVGVPTLNRWSAQAMQIVGYMTSMLPVRLRPAGSLGFDGLCSQAHSSIRKMLAYGRVPLEVLLRETALTPSGNTVFPIWVQFVEDSAATDSEVAGLRLSPLTTKRRNLLAELDVDMVGSATDWHCEWAYRPSLFEEDFMQSMVSDYVATLRHVMAHPQSTVQELEARLS